MGARIIKTTEQIQSKWDSMLCRCLTTKMRLKESYYDIARFATGCSFNGSRRELHLFVINLDLKRMVEIVKYEWSPNSTQDFQVAVIKHNNKIIADIRRDGSLSVFFNIESYKWADLTHKRVWMKDSFDSSMRLDHQYESKSGARGCSDWKTTK